MSGWVVTIDGPSGSGKGTVAQRVAAELAWGLLDSGALYRLTAFEARRSGVALDDARKLAGVAAGLQVRFEENPGGVPRVLLSGEDVSDEIRRESAGAAASRVAALPQVRDALLERQRRMADEYVGLVADGRDMGTVVFPSADVKIFLTASAEERAQRRYKQLKGLGLDVNLPALVREVAERDRRDSERAVAPLRPASDAEVLDTTGMTIDEAVARVLSLVRSRLGL